jgi:deoxycytidylate deaminase
MCRHYKPLSGVTCHSLHAEQNVSRWARPGDTLYVMRFYRNGKLAMAKPCSECVKTIKQAGIRKVFFTNEAGKWEQLPI